MTIFLLAPLFALGAGLLGLSTVRRTRKRLVAAGRPTRTATAVVGVLLVLVAPLGAGALGAHFAWKRSLARKLENGGDEALKQGAAALQAALGIKDPHKKLSADDVRALAAMLGAGNRHSHLESAFFRACEIALQRSHHDLTWDELVVSTRLALSQRVLEKMAEPLHAAAKLDLILLGVGLVLLHGGAITIVWLTCRRRLTVET